MNQKGKVRTVEVSILADIYTMASNRARSQGQRLRAVARTVLFQEAAKTPPSAPVPEGRPPLRPYGQDRTRLKFNVQLVAYEAAKERILASGRSVAAAIEDGLEEYARTGQLSGRAPQ